MKRMILAFSILSALAVTAAEPTSLKLGTDCRVGGSLLRGKDCFYAVGGSNIGGRNQIVRIQLDAAGLPVSAKPAAQVSTGSSTGGCIGAIAGKWLYVSGGDLKDVTVRFEIQADGSLANRTELPNGDRPRFSQSGMVASGKYLIIAGGWQTRLCYAAEIQADGSLGPWVKQRPLPSICFCGSRMFRLGKRIYVAGNQTFQGATDRVFSTEVAEDGAVTKWRRWAELPECAPGFIFQPMPDGKSVFYCNLASQAMYVAPIVEDGEIGEWRKLSAKFPVGPYLSLVGTPLADGRYFRYNMLIDVPRAFNPADLVEMTTEGDRK